MNSILETLRKGTATERLAVIADLFSIVGISGAAVVSSLWAVDWPSNPDAIVGPPAVALLTLAALAFALAVAIFMAGTLREMFGEHPTICIPLIVIVWCLFAVFVLYAVSFAVIVIRSSRW